VKFDNVRLGYIQYLACVDLCHHSQYRYW